MCHAYHVLGLKPARNCKEAMISIVSRGADSGSAVEQLQPPSHGHGSLTVPMSAMPCSRPPMGIYALVQTNFENQGLEHHARRRQRCR